MLHSVPSTERRLSDEKAFSKLSNGKTVAKAQGENAGGAADQALFKASL